MNLPNSWNSHKTSQLPFTQNRSEVSWWWSTLDQLSFACFPQIAYSGVEISCICEGWWCNDWPTNILNKSLYYTTKLMHYGFSCHFSGNGTYFFSNQYCDFNFHRKLLKHFLHDRQLPKDYAKYFFDQIWPIFADIFTKNMKWSPPNSKILCVNQIDRDLKKSRKQQF